jgi:hypothetical protein
MPSFHYDNANDEVVCSRDELPDEDTGVSACDTVLTIGPWWWTEWRESIVSAIGSPAWELPEASVKRGRERAARHAPVKESGDQGAASFPNSASLPDPRRIGDSSSADSGQGCALGLVGRRPVGYPLSG